MRTPITTSPLEINHAIKLMDNKSPKIDRVLTSLAGYETESIKRVFNTLRFASSLTATDWRHIIDYIDESDSLVR